MGEAYVSSHPSLVLFMRTLEDKMTDKHHGTGSGKTVEGKTRDSLRKGGTDTKFETRGKADKGRSPSDAKQLDLAEMIAQAQNGQGLEVLSRRFNLDEQQTRAAINQLAPPVMAGIRRETASPDGLAGLIRALAGGNHSRYLEGDETGIVDDGNAILGHIFGSKDVSRGVAAHAAQTSGISDGTLKQMLPMVAAMIMGALGKKTMGGTGGGIGDLLGQVLGGGTGGPAAASPGTSGGGFGDILGQVLGGSGSASGGGGLGDILGQLTGQGTGAKRPPAGGGGMGDILNSIFGADAPPDIRDQATQRARNSFGQLLGGDSQSGTSADQLLESVLRAVQRR